MTIGDLVTSAAMARGIPANFYPTKGMAQRGGFVKAQLRLVERPWDRRSLSEAPI